MAVSWRGHNDTFDLSRQERELRPRCDACANQADESYLSEQGEAVIILLRLDLDGPPHRNPDGEEIPCPHLHVYREGYGDKWAIPAPVNRYANTLDLFSTFEAFMQHCSITDRPQIQKGLFSS